MPQAIKKPSPITRDNSSVRMEDIPVMEFDARTGAPLFPQDKTSSTNSSGSVKRGAWLSQKLQSLYNDPKYISSPLEEQTRLKRLAYDKWVSPYYKKILKVDPPEWEFWNGSAKERAQISERKEFFSKAHEKDIVHGAQIMKETAHVMGGTQKILAYLGSGLDFLADENLDKDAQKQHPNYVNRIGPVEKFFKRNAERTQDLEDYYQNIIEDHDTNKKKNLIEKVGDKLPALLTDAVFFEALGGAKATKALQLSSPKTASFITRRAVDIVNGATDFTIWNATTGESPKEGAKSGAEFGFILNPLFRRLFQFGGSETVSKVVDNSVRSLVEQGSKDLSEKEGKAALEYLKSTAPKTTTTSTALTKRVEKFTSEQINSAAQQKFGRDFVALPFIQKVYILNKLDASLAAIQKEEAGHVHKEFIQAFSQEEQEQIDKIFPDAAKASKATDEFIKSQGLQPQPTKLLASLPHHNTSVDSEWKHLQARASFLKNKLRRATDPEEKKAIQEALNDEYKLMKEKGSLEKAKKNPPSTVGAATAGDARVFHNDNYTMTHVENIYNSGFMDWYTDSFARQTAKHYKEAADAASKELGKNAPQVQKLASMYHNIDNAYDIAAALSRQARMQNGYTKQLWHPQYGLVGGVNYEIKPAAYLDGDMRSSGDILYINYLGARPNVVAKAWNAPGVGASLFLEAAQEASRRNIGIALTPYDEAVNFYKKIGMDWEGSYMTMNASQVKELLRSKGLLLMLIGAGITYGVNKSYSDNNNWMARGSN